MTLTRPALEEVATLLAGSLSGGRRRRALLDSGPARCFQTDLRTITVPLPLPGETTLRALTCGVALQASPTKEAVARTAWTALSRRQQRALCWEEGEQAVRWARAAWPGLAAELERLFPSVDDAPGLVSAAGIVAAPDPAGLAAALVERALARPADAADPPPLFGRLPRPASAHELGARRTFIATRWSNRHRARRSGALPIPISGPGTEPVVDPGDPGTMEALDGRAGHAIGIPYDEWDGTLGKYRRRHVRVLELDQPAADAPPAPFMPLPDMRPARHLVRGLESGDVDIDAVVRWRVDLATAAVECAEGAYGPAERTRLAGRAAGEGRAPAAVSFDAPRLYCALAPRHEPLAWALLVDASASSALRGGNVLRRSVEQADALARSLTARGEHVGVFAFRSHGRERVEVRVLKHFDRPYRALGIELKPGGYTRLGAALRHTGARLRATPARAHVLVSLGDALPYDEGYGERYGMQDVAKAVEELRAGGAHVLHAALATREDAALDIMFGPANWRHARRDADLLRLIDDVETEIRRG